MLTTDQKTSILYAKYTTKPEVFIYNGTGEEALVAFEEYWKLRGENHYAMNVARVTTEKLDKPEEVGFMQIVAYTGSSVFKVTCVKQIYVDLIIEADDEQQAEDKANHTLYDDEKFDFIAQHYDPNGASIDTTEQVIYGDTPAPRPPVSLGDREYLLDEGEESESALTLGEIMEANCTTGDGLNQFEPSELITLLRLDWNETMVLGAYTVKRIN